MSTHFMCIALQITSKVKKNMFPESSFWPNVQAWDIECLGFLEVKRPIYTKKGKNADWARIAKIVHKKVQK
jgi:hypothetical protein